MDELDLTKEKNRLEFSYTTLLKVQAESYNRENEDTFLVKENDEFILAAVADGGSALSSFTNVNGVEKFSGLFVSQAITTYLEKEFGKNSSATQLILGANNHVKNLLLERGVDPEQASALELPTASGVSIILIDKPKQTVEMAQVGDTAILVDERGQTRLAIPFEMPYFDNLAFSMAQKIAREKNISYKEAIEDQRVGELFINSRLFENETDDQGSGAINGKKGVIRYIKSKTLPLSGINSIVILSDGMYLPTEDFTDDPNWNKIMQVIRDKNLEGLYRLVTELKAEDPEFVRYPRAKKHDDATGIVIRIV